jgi:hypothetical protein
LRDELAIFIEYLCQCLVPTLRPGDIVIIDNLSAHKRQDVRELLEAAGAQLRYLPPYSPDLNLIPTARAQPQPFPQPKSGLPDFGQSQSARTRASPSSGGGEHTGAAA